MTYGLRRTVPLVLAALLWACGADHPIDPDAALSDAALSDAALSDAGPADAASPDAGDGCPADLGTAEGTACAVEATTCGGPCNACGFCNLLVCTGGTWQRLEAFPPPGPCTPFACGPDGLTCQVETQYCAHELSDVGGVPDSYGCVALPIGCTDPDPCACIPGALGACERTPEGGVIVTFGGG